MSQKKRTLRRLALHLLTPILIGLGGIVFSQQWENSYIRTIMLMVSVAIPLLAVGNLWVRYPSSLIERFFLLGGICFLIVGASLSIANVPGTLQNFEVLSEYMSDMVRMVGTLSLLLGLCVVLYTVVRAGEDLGEVGERFRHLAELISEGFIMSSAEGTVVLVNDQFLDMFALSKKDVLGQNASELASRLNALPVHEHIEQRVKGIASEYEMSWRVRGEERRFWFNGRPIFDRQGRHTATIATVRDVTELHRLSQRVERYAQGLQKLVEEQTQKLQDSEARFRQLLLSMNEGFLTIDTGNRVRFVNARICKMLGAPAESILDRDLFEFVDPLSRGRMMNLLVQGAGTQQAEPRQELTLIDQEGTPVPVVAAVAYLRGRMGQEPVFSMVVTSMAEQKEMHRKLEVRARELERANEELRLHGRAKDTFLSNVSHELRTPLSTIQGYMEMLESGSMGVLAGPQAGAIKVMGRNVDRLIGLINEMIEFSRMEIRGVRINANLFAPGNLAYESAASIHPHAMAKDISVNVFVEDGLTAAWGDREKLGQVLGILLNNAVKFTGEGGMITVRVESKPDRTLVLAVSDTGIGIEAQFQGKIFDKFFQVDSSKTRRYEGAGIGLSIAKSVIAAHRGTIEVHSEPGRGSTFIILLPEALFRVDNTPEDLEGIASLRVLLVDEVPESQRAVASFLREAGFEIQTAPNGYECLRMAREETHDLIIINDSPSDLAGLATLGLMKQHPDTENIPTLVFSAESGARLKEAGDLWREVLFVRRPFSTHVLLEQIRAIHFAEPLLGRAEVSETAPEGLDARPYAMVIDSDPGMLEWVELGLARRQIPCCCTQSVPEALRLAEQQVPDVLFVDVDVPGGQAAEYINALCASQYLRKVPLYAMTGLPPSQAEADGVAGVLRKPFSIDEMARLVQQAVRSKNKPVERTGV